MKNVVVQAMEDFNNAINSSMSTNMSNGSQIIQKSGMQIGGQKKFQIRGGSQNKDQANIMGSIE
jgi:hypothetical protein